MKQTIKKFLLPALSVFAVTLGACSDWNETENLGLNYPSLETQNPELYKQYLQALRDYKQGDHKVLIFTMPGSDKIPGKRNEHLITVPDSVDYICLSNPANLHPMLVSEFKEVRKKGTQVLYNISYDALETRWKQILEDEANASAPEAFEQGEGGEEQPEETPESRFLTFCKEQTQLQLGYFGRHGYDGIVVTLTGRAPEGMTAADLAVYTARQEAFFSSVKSWRAANPAAKFVFEGSPQNLVDKSLLADCAYIVIPALSASSADELSYAVLMASVKGVPTDRFVIGVMSPSLSDASDERGYFSSYETDGKTLLRAIKGAGQWAVVPVSNYSKAGVSIANAPDDYFNITLVYKNIRQTIGIMNPAPKN